MKRDINFIKHIKPQLKEKERADKAEARQKKYETACGMHNIGPPGLTVEDVCILASLFRRLHK